MKLSVVKIRVKQIVGCIDDDELAHSLEDALYRDIISWISNLGVRKNVRLICEEALKTEDLPFSRWCA